MEIRTRYRAVTAEDFEFLAGEASPRVARAVCIPPADGGAVPLHIVPRVYPADRQLAYDELVPDEALMQEVAEYLDERRLIGTTVQLLPCRFRGLSVVVNLQASPLADTARVEEDVAHALYTYLNPLVGGSPDGLGDGWAFGRALNQGELYGIVHAVDGVEFVKILRIYETNLETGEQSPKPAGTHIVLEPDELIASGAAHRQGRRTARSLSRRRPTARTARPATSTDLRGRRLRHADGAARDAGRRRRRRSPPAAPTCAAALPAVYQEDDFGMRFVGALETLLDPIVARARRAARALRPRPRAARHPRPAGRLAGGRARRVPDARAAARDGPPRRRAGPQARHACAGSSSR